MEPNATLGKPLKDYTLEDFVTELASDAVMPGAGAAGAVALALAAACAGKAVALTCKHQSSNELQKLQTRLEHIARSALALAEYDAYQFMHQLQSDNPAVTRALLLTDHTITDTCHTLDTLLDEHAHLIAANMEGDWKAARALSDACLFIQLQNIKALERDKGSW